MAAEGSAARASAVQRYHFVGRLAVGGMAEVYVAEAIGVAGVKRRVALKRILPALAKDSAFVTMFLNEARVASTLQHPNIVQTHDVIDNNGEYYIAMELLEGVTLLEFRQRLGRQQRAPTTPLVLYVIDRVLSGLHYAHERRTTDDQPMRVVHRDVSPQNVFLTLDGNVKLLDFGVAKVAALFSSETESGVVKGKLLYMAPEQCQGLDVDRTADIYSVGTLMYVLLTGQHPFRGTNPYETMRAIIHDTPPKPSSFSPVLGPGIDAIVERAMAKRPSDRYQTARDMQRAIAQIVRERRWFLNDLDFAAFVESLVEKDPLPEPSTHNLPPDLVIGEELPEQKPPEPAQKQDIVVAETEHALVERVRGLTVLTLRGAIDERFDSSVGKHLRGNVLVDTEDVTRITSYGIRSLLKTIDASAPHVDGIFHTRCSVPFIRQVNMIPRLLGGGQILSFYLPYIDPVTQQTFSQRISGPQGALVLRSRTPPPASCPGYPDRPAEFDEDPSSYLDFAEDFCAHPPAHVASVIDALAFKEKRRQVEKEVHASGATIFIRRPLDDTFRWRTLLAGLEGNVRIDLDATPTWTDAGISKLVAALDQESDGIRQLTIEHMPRDLYQRLFDHSKLGRLLKAGSVRMHAHCRSCDTPRRIALDIAQVLMLSGEKEISAPCPTCGRSLVLNEPKASPPQSTENQTQKSPSPGRDLRRVRWVLIGGGLAALLLLALVAAISLVLLYHATT